MSKRIGKDKKLFRHIRITMFLSVILTCLMGFCYANEDNKYEGVPVKCELYFSVNKLGQDIIITVCNKALDMKHIKMIKVVKDSKWLAIP